MSAAKKSKGQSIGNAAEVIERFGGIRPMAKKIDVAVTTIQGWKKRDTIPAGRRALIIKAASEHNVEVLDLLDTDMDSEAPIKAPVETSNENQKDQGDEAQSEEGIESLDAETIAETAAIAAAVESVLEKSKPIMLDDEVADTSVPSSSASLKAGPRALDKRLRQTEKNAIKKSTWINISLLLLVLSAVGAYLLFGGQEKANEQRLGALENDVGSLRGDVNAVKEEQSFLSTLIPEDLDARIQRIQDQAVDAQQKVNKAIATASVISNDVLGEDAGSLGERVSKLQEHVSNSTQIQALLAKVQSMSATDQGQGRLDQAVKQLNGVLNNSGAGVSINEALETARNAAPNLEETFAGVPGDELKAAALLLGMTQMRGALNRDNAAFGDDLQLLKNLVGGDAAADGDAQGSSALLEALDKLAPSAEQGVLTPSGLMNEFRTMAGDAVVESLKGEDVSLGDKVTARFSELLQVEKDGALVNGTPTQETLSQAENLLEGGDVAGAIAAVQSLDGPAGAAMLPWLEQAKTTLLANSLKDFLDQGVGAAATGDIADLIPREAKFISDQETGIQILVPGRALSSDVYR